MRYEATKDIYFLFSREFSYIAIRYAFAFVAFHIVKVAPVKMLRWWNSNGAQVEREDRITLFVKRNIV